MSVFGASIPIQRWACFHYEPPFPPSLVSCFVKVTEIDLAQLGIGERAMLLKTPHGNVLWDCFAYLGEETIDFVSLHSLLRLNDTSP